MANQPPPKPAAGPVSDVKAALGQMDLKKQNAAGPQRGRDTKLQQLGRQTISTLYMLVRNVKMYDPDNDIFIQPFENLRQAVNTIIAVDGSYQLQSVATTVYINGKQIQLDFASLDNVRFLTSEFKNRDVGGFNVTRPVQVQELKDFIWIFSPANDKNTDEDGADGRKLLNIKVGKFARIQEQLDKLEDQAIESEQKVDRKKYAMTVYARAIFYMRRFIERLQAGGQLPSMQPALRIVQAQVDRLEREIDAMNAALTPLASFVLPGGAPAAAALHVARTIIRRAERDVTVKKINAKEGDSLAVDAVIMEFA